MYVNKNPFICANSAVEVISIQEFLMVTQKRENKIKDINKRTYNT
jgi:hypothetical protein